MKGTINMNQTRGHKVKILKIFPTKESTDRKGATYSRTPFQWCILFQGTPYQILNGWSVTNGHIAAPQYRSRSGGYSSLVTFSEFTLNRLFEALRASNTPLDPYRPKALAWVLDPNFHDYATRTDADASIAEEGEE